MLTQVEKDAVEQQLTQQATQDQSGKVAEARRQIAEVEKLVRSCPVPAAPSASTQCREPLTLLLAWGTRGTKRAGRVHGCALRGAFGRLRLRLA